MFTHLPLEIRLCIWETILHQTRIVYINMRYLLEEGPRWDCMSSCETDDEGPGFECLCSTPIPVLLHLCTETRTLALAYYELTFGRANAPILTPRTVQKLGWSYKGKEMESVTESNEAEVAKYAPKIYFNFERDTLLFGRTLLPRGEDPRLRTIMGYFPYGKLFDFKQLQRIENLALSITKDLGSDSGSKMFDYLNRLIVLGSFQRLKKLYLCLEANDMDPSQGLELVDFNEKVKEEEGDGGITQEFVDR
jgi:hypothetical protein